ncbi:hypothetical protein HGRIS_009625 [Hohenbuehelia grisea]|uniref:Uncharacterized protein n=1 Tax=Hohenbuehelia grisea TaxID=104357 RepID=A0ABR3J1Q6_9AGAR
MVNWSDPVEIGKQAAAFQNLIYALFGLYVWELFSTCDFEWSYLTPRVEKRREWKWGLGETLYLCLHIRVLNRIAVFTFLCRYCMLFAFIGLVISFSVTSPINCIALYTFNSWTGNMAILCASTSLMLRTIALWSKQMTVVVPLVTLSLGHWGILYRGMFLVKASWDPTVGGCVVTQTNPSLLNITFFYTMGFDAVILVFTMVALLTKHNARTDLWNLLFKDGLVYFIITFTVNCIPAVLNVLNLNTMMNVIAAVPAATVSTIAATRAATRLLKHGEHKNDVYVQSSQVISANRAHGFTSPRSPVIASPHSARPTVRVVTEQFDMENFSPSDSPYSNKEDRRSSSFDLPIVNATDEKAAPQYAI